MNSPTFSTFNPATATTLQTYQRQSSAEVDKILEKSMKSNTQNKTVAARVQMLQKLGEHLRANRDELSLMISSEMGKALVDSRFEIEKSATAFDYYAQNLESFLAEENVPAARGKIVKDSLGPILAIMPWNFPVWQVVRFAAPAVAIGNPILLKHSDLTAGTATLIEKIFNNAQEGLLFNLRVDHSGAAEIIKDPRCRAVTLTGSTRAGREVAAIAGAHLKKVVLELGGSDAYVVFADADVEHAAKICATARMINNGQSCIAAKRFVIHESVYESFALLIKRYLGSYKSGNPLDPETKVGSLAGKKFQLDLLNQCKILEKEQQAEKIFDFADDWSFDFEAPAAFFPPRAYLLDRQNSLKFDHEFFGPVLTFHKFSSPEEALQIANSSPFGLGAAVFSKDNKMAETFARQLEAGLVAINNFVRSSPELPFGGVKNSGHGRELGLYGLNEFCNIKSILFSD